MAVDFKTIEAEISDGVSGAMSKIAELQAGIDTRDAEIASLKATVGNVPDEDAAVIRGFLADLKAAYAPKLIPTPQPAPQAAPAPPTNLQGKS